VIPERSTDVLNSDVTMAILHAEGSVRDAIAAWEAVAKTEQAIADHPDVPDDQRAIADRGVGYARKTIDILYALIGGKK
jgi:hypothetical protein